MVNRALASKKCNVSCDSWKTLCANFLAKYI